MILSVIIIIPPHLTYTAYAARTLFMKLTAAVEDDSRLTDNKYYSDPNVAL